MAEIEHSQRPWTSLLALFGVSALLLSVGVVTLQRVARSAITLRDTTDQVMVITRTSQALLATINDATTAEYGYVSTQRRSYLNGYWGAPAQVAYDLHVMDRQAADYEWLRPMVEILKTSIASKMLNLQRGVALAKNQLPAAAIAGALNDPNDTNLASIRMMVGQIVTRAWGEREHDSEELDAALLQAARTAFVLVLIGLPLLIFIASRILATRKRITESLRSAHLQFERLKSAINQIPAGVAVFDSDERLVLWNAKFFANATFSSRLHRSGTSYEAFHQVMQDWSPPVARPREPGEPTRPLETKAGRRVLELWRGEMPGGGLILVISDITRRTEAEMMLHQAGKMESLGQLIGGMAHDFNNLLQVIATNLDLMAGEIGGHSQAHKNLTAAQAGVDSAARLTKQLLSFARRQPLITAPLDFTACLGKLEDILRRTLGPSVTITTKLQSELWPMLADAAQLEAAVLNLVLNARDAMPQGGSLSIEAVNAVLTQLRSGDLRPGEYVIVTVTDNGAGMTREQLSRAVEPFYTTKPDGQGTGLGLSMVYGFMSQIGGSMRIKSEPGQGTIVQLSFPRSLKMPEEIATGDLPSSPQGKGELVLVVDDDNAVRAASSQSVASLGYQVCDASSGMEAMELIQNGLRPALIFSDVVMPGPVDGVALAQFVGRYDPTLPVLLTSGYTEHPDTQARIASLGITVLPKPWRIEELARHLRQILDWSGPREVAVQSPPSSIHILLVDDEPALLEITATALTSLGYQVTAVADAGSAIVASNQSRPDLLVSDRHLPDMDGVHLALYLRRTRPELPVIIISGDPPDRSLRGMSWLQKPFSIKTLRSAIGDVLGAYLPAQ